MQQVVLILQLVDKLEREYVKFETRASNAELFYSEQSDASDTFEVEEKKISFNLKLND